MGNDSQFLGVPDDAYLQKRAEEYLRKTLGETASTLLDPIGRIDENPLEGEGSVGIFRAAGDASPGDEPHPIIVVAGQTEANYYPDWGLSLDEWYDVHLGTQFMLVAEVAGRRVDDLPDDLESWFRAFFADVAPAAQIERIEPRIAFQHEEQIHVVALVTLTDEEVWCIGYHAPPGIYRTVRLPPHVVYRRHLGHLIRVEARQAAKHESSMKRA